MYEKVFKRFLDFVLSLTALIVLSPVLLILTVAGAIAMRGNPFFTQLRPGKIDKRSGKEKIFRLIKFRTMSNAKDANGNLLPDGKRLNAYGRFLRSTSLDELLELVNILRGDMSIVGPRPLAVQYLGYYNETERRRHEVLPGLTGLAQINGFRGDTSIKRRIELDVQYIENWNIFLDISILFKTVFRTVNKEKIRCDETTVNTTDQQEQIDDNEKQKINA